jgi:hypothetical protein
MVERFIRLRGIGLAVENMNGEGKASGWKVATRAPHLALPDTSKMPMPAQLIYDAVRYFASAALNGAEVYMQYNEVSEKPFVTAEAKNSRFVMVYNDDKLLIYFEENEKIGNGTFEYRKREIAIDCSVETAKTIVSGTVTALLVGIREGIVQPNPKLDSVFSSPPHP